MNIQHLPCVAIIVAVCAVVVLVALSLARKVNFGAGGGGNPTATGARQKSQVVVGSAAIAASVAPQRQAAGAQPTRTIPNEH